MDGKTNSMDTRARLVQTYAVIKISILQSDGENNSDMDDDDDSGGHDSEDDGIDDESNTNETDDDEYDDTDDSDDFNENESRNKNDSIIQARRNKILSGVCQNQVYHRRHSQ